MPDQVTRGCGTCWAKLRSSLGLWALILVVAIFINNGAHAATQYIDSRNFTEPMFVFAITVVAGTRPILQPAMAVASFIGRVIPLPGSIGFYFTVLALVPLLGSFITEPAAMTLAALILAQSIFARAISPRLKYATLGVLFVNVSIGGTLTPFAAPPILMVAGKWNWDIAFMLSTIGWKAAVAVVVNALGAAFLFRHELGRLSLSTGESANLSVPLVLVVIHVAFLAGIVVFAHHPAMFMGLFLFFLGVAHAYERDHDRLLLREGLSDEFKYSLVTGAVTGGRLTIIANAPNPAGIAILHGHFADETVHPLGLLLGALRPTLIAVLAFRFL